MIWYRSFRTVFGRHTDIYFNKFDMCLLITLIAGVVDRINNFLLL